MTFFFKTLLQIFKLIIFLILPLYDFNNLFDQVLLILTGSIINESICFFIASDTESASDSDADFEEIRQDLIDSMYEDEKSKAKAARIAKDEADPEGKAGRLAEDAAEAAAEARRRNGDFEADRRRIEQDLIRIAEEVAEADAARKAARIAKAESEGFSEGESEGYSEVEFEVYSEAKSEGFSGTGLLSKKRKSED